MARFEDARAGWEIFRNSGYAATMDEINVQLVRRNFVPIAPRTYSHYLKLKRNGYLQYISINQLDIKTLKDPFWDSAVRNRYAPLEADYAPIVIFFVLRGREVFIHGTAIETSSSSTTCRISDSEAIALLRHKYVQDHLRRERVSISFATSGSAFAAYLEGMQIGLNDQSLVLSFGFVSLAAVDLMLNRVPLQTSNMVLRVTPTTDHTAFSEIARKLYWLFQASEAVRLACEDMLTQIDPDRRFVVPSTRIQTIQMRSPLQLAITFAIPIVALLFMIVDEGTLPEKRKNKKASDTVGSDRLEQWVETTHQAVMDATRIQTDQPVSPRVQEIFREQLAPAILELFDEASGKIEVLTDRRDSQEDGEER